LPGAHCQIQRRTPFRAIVRAFFSIGQEPGIANQRETGFNRSGLFRPSGRGALFTGHGVSFCSESPGVSSRKLSEVSLPYTGKLLSQIIDERLVTEARRMLLYSGLLVKEIGFRLEYAEPSCFARVFRRITGSTLSACMKVPDFFPERFVPAQSFMVLYNC
jgi:AraC-like DNA-binding protein